MEKNFEDLLSIHQERVSKVLKISSKELDKRAEIHDTDKINDPRIYEIYKEHFPYLKQLEFGSQEYKEYELKHFEKAHHLHVQNRHHFYDYRNNLNDINLFDLLEAIIDVDQSSRQYNENYNLDSSVNTIIQKKITDETLEILVRNTLKYLNEQLEK